MAQALLSALYGVEEPDKADAEYLHGLTAAAFAATDYALAAFEIGSDREPPVPPALLAQARLAARHQVPLDVVMRRCFSGFAILVDFMVAGAEASGIPRRQALGGLFRSHSAQVDRLVDAMAEEYKREASRFVRSSEKRRAERVERLLAGEPVELTDIGYALTGWHLGIVMRTEDRELPRALADRFDALLLCVSPQPPDLWVWLGARRRLESEKVAAVATELARPGDQIALGEAAEGVEGWRHTHRQARAALPVLGGLHGNVGRYADLGLISSVMSDRTLATSLRQMYIEPLADERDGGRATQETLRAYFACGRNMSSAAASLGVNRQTVRKRLRAFEEKAGSCLDTCAVEVELALRLDEYRTGQSGLTPIEAMSGRLDRES
ncbi:MAG TPA: helix-turn-helix domain-containing protein [Solirubrobacterales bacterium]|nr:helix-turn-helix domain-containing protein [Solirubrobacterales bacterium]